MSPRFVLALVAAAVATLLAAAVPVLDEESYLDIARQLTPLRPYDWWRPWPPWGLDRDADVFIYAHPPGFLVWVWSWVELAGSLRLVAPIKMAAGLPWAMLFAWALGRLAERTSRRPWLVCAVWISSPIVLLSLQRGLMPDLVLAALLTTAVVSWLEGHGAPRRGERLRWFVGGGLALAAAASIKYSALVLVPALLLHQMALRPRPRALAFWLPALLTLVAMESWLAMQYGRGHLIHVVANAGEIGRSETGARALGLTVRLGFGVLLWPLLLHRWRAAAVALLAGGVVLTMLGAPEGTAFDHRVQLLVWSGLGLGWITLAARELFSPRAPAADRTASDGILLGAWALAGVAGVLVGHNFAAPRYLLPTLAPLSILLVRAVTHRIELRAAMWGAAAVSAVGSLAMVWSEHRFFDAGDAAARSVVLAAPEGGCFTGEWSFRHHLQQEGWTFCGTLEDMQALPSGSLIAAPRHASPGELPTGLEPVHEASFGWSPLRMIDAENGVGWYGESLGTLPVQLHPGALEVATVWRVP